VFQFGAREIGEVEITARGAVLDPDGIWRGRQQLARRDPRHQPDHGGGAGRGDRRRAGAAASEARTALKPKSGSATVLTWHPVRYV
jgi:hypothetical protein